jgi:hypothetical protein
VRCRHWGRSQSVVRPGPGPSSRTSPPKSTPLSDQGKISVSSLCLQRFDWQYHRCSQFILSPTIANGNRSPAGESGAGGETGAEPPTASNMLYGVPAIQVNGQAMTLLSTLPRARAVKFENARILHPHRRCG